VVSLGRQGEAVNESRAERFRRALTPFHDVVGSFAARAALLPVAGAAAIVCSRRVVDIAGVRGFAIFSIFITLPGLFPVSDFGLGATLTDVVAKTGLRSPQTAAVWRAALNRLRFAALAACVAGAVLALLGLWPSLLGLPEGSWIEVAGFATLAILGLSIPLGLGQRAQLGAGRQTRATVLLSTGSVLSLILVVCCGAVGVTVAAALAVAYLLGALAPQAALFMLSRQEIAGNEMSQLQPEDPGLSVVANAWPMAIISIALPLAYQADRVILAHASTLVEVARYSACSTLYLPLLSVVLLGSQGLWPLFLRLGGQADRLPTIYFRSFLLSGTVGLALAIALIGLGKPLIAILSHGQIHVSSLLLLAFGGLLLMFALHAPSGMFLMDLRGRRIQAIGAVLLVVVKLPVGYLIAPTYGATGLVVTTLACAMAFMVIPALVVSLRRVRSQHR
jgi:O-antigen/teichoic acid export membrane protein